MQRVLLILAAMFAYGPAVADSVVAARNIPANSVIGADDIRLATANIAGSFTSLDSVTGQETRRFIYAGRPVMIRDVGAPALVERNQTVKLVYKIGTLMIATDGRSLDRAGVGDSVRVINLSSRTTISGTVSSDGTVAVSHPNTQF